MVHRVVYQKAPAQTHPLSAQIFTTILILAQNALPLMVKSKNTPAALVPGNSKTAFLHELPPLFGPLIHRRISFYYDNEKRGTVSRNQPTALGSSPAF